MHISTMMLLIFTFSIFESNQISVMSICTKCTFIDNIMLYVDYGFNNNKHTFA